MRSENHSLTYLTKSLVKHSILSLFIIQSGTTEAYFGVKANNLEHDFYFWHLILYPVFKGISITSQTSRL